MHKSTALVRAVFGQAWCQTDSLVDEIGGLEAAIAAAAELAGLTDHSRVELPEQKDLFEQIMEDLSGRTRTWVASAWLGNGYGPPETISIKVRQGEGNVRDPSTDAL